MVMEDVYEDVTIHTVQYRYWSIAANGAVLPMDAAGAIDTTFGINSIDGNGCIVSTVDGVIYHLPAFATPYLILACQRQGRCHGKCCRHP